jgi:hypothetical protein
MSVTRSLTPRFPTSATRSGQRAITAALAVLAVLVLTFGFTARSGAVTRTVGHVVAGRLAFTAAEHEIAMFENRGYIQAACTTHGTLMLNRHTNQTRMIKL